MTEHRRRHEQRTAPARWSSSMLAIVALFVGLLSGAIGAGASVSPDSLMAVMAPGESITETKDVYVPPAPPAADVVFAFDLTGSMSGIINTAKTQAENILNQLGAIPGVDVQFGVMSYMDYPYTYDSYGYAAEYGTTEFGCGDYAYNLDQPVTADGAAVVAAINSLLIGCGSDGPQDYTRIFHESYADPAVGFRDGAKRILVNFGDNVPHDDDLNLGVPLTSGSWSTGGDPGRDETMFTGDDLDLQTVLSGMASEGVVLLEAHTFFWDSWVDPYLSTQDYWEYWTGVTGGAAFLTTSSTLVDDIVGEVIAELSDPEVVGLTLEAEPGFESWIAVSPESHTGLTNASYAFDLTITVPADTPAGIYEFMVYAVDGAGVGYGEQTLSIVVYDPSAGFVTGGGWIDSPVGAFYPSELPFSDGSYYELIESPGVSWVDAHEAAVGSATPACSYPHLVTITSQAEQDALYGFFGEALQGKWYGGYQEEGQLDPDAGWQWVTGEDWIYTNWADGEPNDAYGPGTEQHLLGWELGWSWNDEYNLGNVTGYVVEYDECFLPTGKATFGFVSKYKKGADTPTGNTEFQFHAAGLNFHSTSYEWLVVTGSDYAKFKGAGTINGEGEFSFMLWAGDGEPDTFRIKIWTEDEFGIETVVYDNGMDQPISSGSIIVHTKKK